MPIGKRYYDFYIKRLSSDRDFNNLKNINDFRKNPDSAYLAGYVDHYGWLNSIVLPDIKKGNRIAFGVYKRPSDQGTLLYNVEEKENSRLLGSVIFKKEISGEVQIKNILTDSSAIEMAFTKSQVNAIKKIIHEKLIERVEKFCAYRKLRRLETEVPAKEYGLIDLFLKKGYNVVRTTVSKYKRGDNFYSLSKELLSIFGNDPFDYYSICSNVIKLFYPLRNFDQVQRLVPKGYTRNGFVFELILSSTILQASRFVKSEKVGNLEKELSIVVECIVDISNLEKKRNFG